MLWQRSLQMNARNLRQSWPDLTGLDLLPTTDALHLFSQVVGKVRLMLTPWINQSWHATFYLSARGFTTGVVHAGVDSVEMEFDLLDDMLRISVADGKSQRVSLTFTTRRSRRSASSASP
jgi:hypothetical protein